MNNLTTRKIVLGMLLALVLAFSVQGTAEAITKFTKTSSTDNQIVSIQQPFTIRFSVSLQDNQRIPNTAGTGYIDQDDEAIDKDGYFLGDNGFYKNDAGQSIDTQGYLRNDDGNRYNANNDAIDTQGYLLSADGTHTTDPKTKATVGTNPTTQLKAVDTVRTKTTPLNQYYYNEQSISITPDPDNIIFTKGSTEVTSLSQDAEESDERLSSSISLSGRASIAGVYSITIADTTGNSDTPTGYTAATSITFTITVLQAAETTRALTVTSGLSDDIVGEFGIKELSVTVSGATANARVEFEITKGSGSISAENTVGSKTSKRLSTLTNASGIATVTLDPKKKTNHVRAWIYGNAPGTENKSTEGIYIYRWAILNKVSGDSGDSGDPQLNQKGPVSSRLEDPFVVQLFDSTERTTIPGAQIVFTATASPPGSLRYDPITPSNLRGDPLVSTATTAMVKTDPNGKASIFLVLGATSDEDYTVTAAYGTFDTQTFTATSLADTVTPKAQSITKVAETDGQRANEYGLLKKPLTVVVRDQGGRRLTNTVVRFVALDGGTIDYESTDPGNAQTTNHTQDGTIQEVPTDASGEASIRWSIDPDIGGRRTVRASIKDTDKSVVFTINGAPSRGGGDPDPPPATTGSLEIDVSGEGTTRTVTVRATSAQGTPVSISVTLTGTATSTQVVTTGTATEIILPTAPGDYTLTATASVTGYAQDTETITVAGPTSLGTISITQIGTPTNGVQTFSITVRRTDGTTPAPLRVTVSGTGFTTRSVPTANGAGAIDITLPTTAATYTLTASAEEYESGTATVRIAGTGQLGSIAPPPDPTIPIEEQPAAEPDSVSIVGPSQRSGTANAELDAALIVQVADDDGDAVADARVIFRVRTGQGRLSARGNGRAIAVQTDSSGYGRANYTPMSASSTVEAEARGVTRTVTFTITASGGSAAPTPRDTGTGGTPGTVSPVVHVAAAQRPPMLWVDGGAIYALVDADVKEFAPGVDNALNIAVGGGKVYWTEKTGESSGTINSANLDGSDVTELVSVRSVPMGIAVDTAGRKLYWTASSGKIKRADLDGSGSENVVPGGLESPMDLALADGNVYWTQGNGSVRFANLTGRININDISTGSDTPGSLAIGGGKVYWTEKTAASAGTINSANLNGRGATQLTSIRSVPMGIAVDTARSKLYWTASSGKVKQANLNGSGAKNVVSGLGSPSDMVLSNSIATPAATPTTPKSTTTASKYDLNSDGAVDNADAALVADAMGTSNTKYDVNGDGTVNFLDLLLVFDNRDPGAAGAPTIVGMKLSAAQIDRIEEQIDLLIATNDRSPAAMRVLVYLQQLLVTARPEKTQLLANYPNPFNPETWIPYELATDTNVKITIYNTQGVVIRSLQFGQQSAGYYVGRDRAAYWDGRNALGEQVASGLYFYQLETDEMSSMRKMVILK